MVQPSKTTIIRTQPVRNHGQSWGDHGPDTNTNDSTSNVCKEDTISLNSYENYSQSECTLNCSSVKQKYTSKEFLVESYFKSETILQHFIQNVNLTIAVTLEQERIDQEVRLKHHLNRFLMEHSIVILLNVNVGSRRGDTRTIKEFAII